MNKKRLNSVLLIGVVAIWGLLIYKFFGNSFMKHDEPQNSAVIINEELPITIGKDTFKLKTYNRDPFLEKTIKNEYSKYNKGLKIKEATVVKWPQLQYLGFVKESTAKEPLLLLKVNGKLMRKKSSFEFYEGLEVLKFYKDSLLLRLNSNEKVLLKNRI